MSHKIGTAATYAALLEELDAFLCDQGHAWGLTFEGAGTGRLTDYIGTASSVTETITATATSATSFTVVGSVSGALGTATVGTPFTSSVVNFTITAGGTAFVAGDLFRLNTGPAWERLRFGGCLEALHRTASFSNVANLFDDTTSEITTTVYPATITVEMFKATEVRSFALVSSFIASQTPSEFGLQWSDDGSSWTTAQSWSGQSWTAAYQRRDYVLTSSAGAHRYWRINITAGNSTMCLSQAFLYADAAAKWEVSRRFEFAWKAPGVDGAQDIFVAGYTYTDNGASTYNLVFRGFRYWLDPEQSVLNVPNHLGDKALPLSKTPTAYWLVANSGRVMVVTRTSAVYGMAYAGYGLPYETPSVHPFPYLIGAPAYLPTMRWDTANTGGYRNPVDPGAQSTASNGTLGAIFPDGAGYQVVNRTTSGSSSEGANDSAGRPKVWPYCQDDTGNIQSDHLRECVDGSMPLLPLVIFQPGVPQAHAWGEFDGAYWTTGFNNSAEALIREGAIDHLVVPNVNRSNTQSFAAIALD